MRIVRLEEVTEAVERLAIEASHVARKEMIEKIEDALEVEESEVGRDILKKLLENAEIAEREKIPYCQDTGVALIFVELGEEVAFDSSGFIEAINEGVRRGYKKGYLGKSIVKDPLRRENTGDNTPAIVHIDLVKGDRLKIKFCAKGSGSENMSRVKMLKPAEGWEGIKSFVLETVKEAGPNPCPPIIIGLGIGGNLERAPLLAKKALYRGIGTEHSDPFYAEKERELLEEINSLGIGPQGMGGRVTALEVHIEEAPCHIGSLPVAVVIDCHAHRYREVEL